MQGTHRVRRFKQFPIKKKRKRQTFGSKVNSAINRRAEKKQKLVFANTTVDTSGVIKDITNIAEGDGNGTRDGIQIRPHSLKIKYEVIVNDPTNLLRVVVIVWKNDSNENPPTMSKIFETITNVIPLSPFLFKGTKVFTVLYDRVHSLSDLSMVSQSASINIFSNRLPATIEFDDATFEGSNKLYIISWSDSGSINHPTFNFSGAFEYIDY